MAFFFFKSKSTSPSRMASVYYLYDDALRIADDIVHKYSQKDENQKENHYAATVIQRTYRSYVARKAYKFHINAIIVLQKYIRGWLVRYHLPDIMAEYWDIICQKMYNRAATRIQSLWRGKMVRKEIDIKKIMETKLAEEERIGNLTSELDIDFKKVKESDEETNKQIDDGEAFGGTPLGDSSYLQQQILEIMFDRHHLLSTQVQQGVMSANKELVEVEKVLKSLHYKDYVMKLRKLYYKYRKKQEEIPVEYLFTDKRMKKQEDLLRLRDNSRDCKEVYLGQIVADKREPFKLSTKLKVDKYKRMALSDGTYTKRITDITRTEDRSKIINDQDFILTLKRIVKDSKVPPYYADFWYQECTGHHI